MNTAGLRKVTKTVRGKKGAVQRSYWVKATGAVKKAGRFLNKHKGKIAAGAALAGAAYLGVRHGSAIKGAVSGALHAHKVSRGFEKATGLKLSGKERLAAIGAGAGIGRSVGAGEDRARMDRIRAGATSAGNSIRSAATSAGNSMRSAAASAGKNVRSGVASARTSIGRGLSTATRALNATASNASASIRKRTRRAK